MSSPKHPDHANEIEMKIQLSKFGNRICERTGILKLMDDLGSAMSGENGLLMLGGGNPAAIPKVQSVWRERMDEILADGTCFDNVLANYDLPKGRPAFIHALVDFLNRHYDWKITERNIAITNGSQNAFFCLFNMIAGEFEDDSRKHILLPLCPEYIGYADQGLDAAFFRTTEPSIEKLANHRFKYHIDFDRLTIDADTAAICVSRPTNPSANVLTNQEITRLSDLAKANDCFLMIDNAYGAPFPGIVFDEDFIPFYDDHVIVSLSLSKLGLPGTRTGIVIANESVIDAVSAANAVVSLANGNLGQEIVTPLLVDDRILDLSRNVIRPFYERKSRRAMTLLDGFLDDALPYYIHVSEGAMFLWLWCENLPIPSSELYERLKTRGVIVVPGHYFFFGSTGTDDRESKHRNECIRINHSRPDANVSDGLKIIAEEISRVYREL